MNFKIFIILVLILFSCKSQSNILSVKNIKNKTLVPPGTVKISDNFFADIREINNSMYREFMHYTRRICGIESKEFSQIIPDLSFSCGDNVSDSFLIEYFSHPIYNDYPLVGISLEQVKLYSNWRSNRVAEMMLINLGLIKVNINQNCDNQFTIENYIEGTYEAIIKYIPDLIFPKYTIPTVDEWELISGVNTDYEYGLDSLSKHNKKLLKKSIPLFNTKDAVFKMNEDNSIPENTSHFKISTSNFESGYQNIYGLYNIIGNVSEMVDSSNIAKGGSWIHYLNEIDLKNNNKTPIPNCWTGFRNICRYENP